MLNVLKQMSVLWKLNFTCQAVLRESFSSKSRLLQQAYSQNAWILQLSFQEKKLQKKTLLQLQRVKLVRLSTFSAKIIKP